MGPCGSFALIKACHRKQMKDGQILPEAAKPGVLIRLIVRGDACSMNEASIMWSGVKESEPRAAHLTVEPGLELASQVTCGGSKPS